MEAYTSYKKKYSVEISNADFQMRLKPSCLFEFMQDAASLAAGELGFGHEALIKAYNVAWVLTRLRLEINRLPSLGESMEIETWHMQHGRITFDRDFIVYGQGGEILAQAVSTWVIMDMTSREIKRADTIDFNIPVSAKGRAIDGALERLKPIGELFPAYERKIAYSDIDLNGHVNNAKYVEYIFDSLSIDEHRSMKFTSIDVNYSSEMSPGETLSVKFCEDDTSVYVEGENSGSSAVVFKAKIGFKRVKSHGA